MLWCLSVFNKDAALKDTLYFWMMNWDNYLLDYLRETLSINESELEKHTALLSARRFLTSPISNISFVYNTKQ